MIKKTVTFKDLEGEEIVRDFYFHINKGEMLEMQMRHNGKMTDYISRMVEEHDAEKLTDYIRNLIKMSYGVKSTDGITFDKSEEQVNRFMYSDAYSELLWSLMSDTDELVAFVNGIFPKEIQEKASKLKSDDPSLTPEAREQLIRMEQRIKITTDKASEENTSESELNNPWV